MKSDDQVLKDMAEILTPEVWIKGTLCVRPGEGETVILDGGKAVRLVNDTAVDQLCMDGALQMATFGRLAMTQDYRKVEGTPEEAQYLRLYEHLCQKAGQYHGRASRTIEHFNDEDATTYEDVQLVIKSAMEG